MAATVMVVYSSSSSVGFSSRGTLGRAGTRRVGSIPGVKNDTTAHNTHAVPERRENICKARRTRCHFRYRSRHGLENRGFILYPPPSVPLSPVQVSYRLSLMMRWLLCLCGQHTAGLHSYEFRVVFKECEKI